MNQSMQEGEKKNILITELTVILSQLFKEFDQGSTITPQPFWNFNTLIKHQPSVRNQLIHSGAHNDVQGSQVSIGLVKRAALNCSEGKQGLRLNLYHLGSVSEYKVCYRNQQTDQKYPTWQDQSTPAILKLYCQNYELSLSVCDPEFSKIYQWLLHVSEVHYNLFNASKGLLMIRNQEIRSLVRSMQKLSSLPWFEIPIDDPESGRTIMMIEDASSIDYDWKKDQGSAAKRKKGLTAREWPKQECSCRNEALTADNAKIIILLTSIGYFKYG